MLETFALLMIAFQLKHLICDFVCQPPFMFMNKGTYGHWGGIAHSLMHVIGTTLIGLVACFYLPITTIILLLVCGVEFILHYHIDWAKMNLNKHFGWGATTHSEFWVLLGVDQLLHQLTYIGIVVYLLM